MTSSPFDPTVRSLVKVQAPAGVGAGEPPCNAKICFWSSAICAINASMVASAIVVNGTTAAAPERATAVTMVSNFALMLMRLPTPLNIILIRLNSLATLKRSNEPFRIRCFAHHDYTRNLSLLSLVIDSKEGSDQGTLIFLPVDTG